MVPWFSWLFLAIAIAASTGDNGGRDIQKSDYDKAEDFNYHSEENFRAPGPTYTDTSYPNYEDYEDFIERRLEFKLYNFKQKIIEAIEKMKNLLAYGDKENNIPPVDSFFLPLKKFNVTLRDMAVTGYLQNVTFADFSNFELDAFKLILLPLHFKLDFRLDQFQIDGNYKLQGEVLDVPVNGIGQFMSEIENLTLSLYLRFTTVNDSYQIQDFIYDVKTLNVVVNYTNELEGDGFKTLDENLTLHFLEQLQFNYLPPLITATEIFNRFQRGFSAADAYTFFTNFLNKKLIHFLS